MEVIQIARLMTMVQKQPTKVDYRDQIQEYYKNMAEQWNATYNRLSKIEAKLTAISDDLIAIQETANADREEFEDTIHTLVESMKELVIPRDPYYTQ